MLLPSPQPLLELQGTALAAAANAIVITDRQGIVLWANPAFTTLSGYTVAEAVGRNPRELVKSGQEDPAVYQRMWDTILAGRTWHGELLNRRKDGSVYPEDLTITPVRDAAGAIAHFIAIKYDLTERRDAERTLRRSEGRWRTLVRAIPDLVWLKDASGTYLSCNSAFERFLGAAESAIVGHTDHDFLSQELADSFRFHDQAAMAAGQPTSNEEWLTFAQDGHRGLFQTVKVPMRDEDGTLVGVLGVARDITRWQAAETAVVASELRYRRLFESAKDGILILDAATGKIVDVNPFLVELLGFSHAQFLGKKIWELGFFHDIIANQVSFAELQQNEFIRYEDKPLKTADGRQIDVEFVSNVYLVDDQKVIQCNVRDITARKTRDRLLREQNEILANSREGVMIASLSSQISLWNRGAAEIFGWKAAEALGRLPEEMLGITDPGVMVTLREAVARQGFWHGELPARTRDGRPLTINCRTTLVQDESGRPRARLSFLADVTEQKLLEKISLRAQRLEAVGTLSSGLAHDLNNILTPILMAVGMLREHSRETHDRELLGLVESSAQRGAAIIRQLLMFGRGIEGQRVHVQLRYIIKEMAAIARETFPRNITLVEETQRDLWPVIADATQLHQVLMNLCVNARDAMPEGGRLTLSAKNQAPSAPGSPADPEVCEGPCVVISIRDTGLGISPEVIDRIFEPFFTTKGPGLGSGLGLPTVLGIVRSHRGIVTVESTPSFGTVFHVYLPAAPEGALPRPTGETVEDSDGAGETILVVDDEPAVLATVRRCLSAHGYEVLSAKNGEEALALFRAHRTEVRLLVTDVMMPVMDGLKFARLLREMDSKVRVIASSGLDPVSGAGEAPSGVIAEFLPKPYDRHALLDAVRRQLALVQP